MFTESEFNMAMADLEGVDIDCNFVGVTDVSVSDMDDGFEYYLYRPYNDLNQLMPLAWKHKLDLDYHMSTNSWRCETKFGDLYGDNKDPIQSIRYCLWLIHKENSNE